MQLALAALLAIVGVLPGQAMATRVPQASAARLFADGIAGPEGLAFGRRGRLYVGTSTGELLRFTRDGTREVVGSVGEPLAGITVLRDGRVLAASFTAGRIWRVEPDTGEATVLASSVPGANFIVETRGGRILASASLAGTIVDVTAGTPVERATGLSFPNGLAIRGGFLYVAELLANRISRLPLARDGTLGPAEVYATEAVLPDGLVFDRAGNLLVAGGGTLQVVPAGSATAVPLSASDPLLDGPSNLVFGRGRGFRPRDLYVANFGLPIGSGTQVVVVRLQRGRRDAGPARAR